MPMIESLNDIRHESSEAVANWVTNANALWDRRRLLARIGMVAFVVGMIVAVSLPKQYESTAILMPPEGGGTSSAMLAALVGHSGASSSGLGGGLGSLAGTLLGTKSSGVLFVELLHSRSIADHIIDRFGLQRIYHKRYRIDAVKYLARRTSVVEDKKSGVLIITFTDTDATRARDITKAYIEELNTLMTRANTSSARREREFIERRLTGVQADLQDAQIALSTFSSNSSTLDIKEQTRAMVDAAAKLEGEKIVGESELASLEQIYGDGNVRVRAAKARVGDLQHELNKMSGSSDVASSNAEGSGSSYPTLRQIPRLAVPYANLYRRVRIQETVYELLSQQYEMARIEEAKDTPVVSVIDSPLIAEKKSFPPRLIIILVFTMTAVTLAAMVILFWLGWERVEAYDPRKLLVQRICESFHSRSFRLKIRARGER